MMVTFCRSRAVIEAVKGEVNGSQQTEKDYVSNLMGVLSGIGIPTEATAPSKAA